MIWIFCLLLLLASCSSDENHPVEGEFIYRQKDEHLFTIPAANRTVRPLYPWEQGQVGGLSKVTKEFFRCKGSSLNPPHKEMRNEEMVIYSDCGGAEKHSLPLRDGKEGVYPILVDLLNYVQAKTKKKVVITSGHRCPDHNLYVDSSPTNQFSKHTIGAEVTFYVQGLEEKPESIIKLLQDYYKQDPAVQNEKKYTEFKRYEKQDTNVSTLPWMNHEIFIKLFRKKEGRDFDNRHPYPYINIQVRFDREKQQKVIYTWDQAYNHFLRY